MERPLLPGSIRERSDIAIVIISITQRSSAGCDAHCNTPPPPVVKAREVALKR